MRLLGIGANDVLAFEHPFWLDLSELRGLIAIAGRNGAGKTSLLELVPGTIDREFPSRDKSPYAYALSRTAYTEIAFALEVRGAFRARQNLDPVSRSSEAVLSRAHDDGSLRLTDDGAPDALTDGKVSTYDRAIAQLFPSARVRKASTFAAQNRSGSFITAEKRGREDLFSELLGLAHYEQMAETARQAVILIDQARARLIGQRDAVAATCTEAMAEAITTAGDQVALSQRVWTSERDRRAESLGTLEAQRTRLEAAARAHTAAVQRRDAAAAAARTTREAITALEDVALRAVTIAKDLAVVTESRATVQRNADAAETARQAAAVRLEAYTVAVQTERDAAQALLQAQRDISRAEADLAAAGRALRAELADLQQQHDTSKASLDARIAKNRTLLADADQIRAALHAATLCEASLTRLREQRKTLQARLDAGRTELRELTQVAAARARLAADIARDEEDAGTLAAVPCPSIEQPFANCQFLVRAAQARERSLTRTAELADMADPTEAAAALEINLDADATVMDTIDDEIASIEASLATHRQASEHHVQLAQVEERLATYAAASEELAATLTQQRHAAEMRGWDQRTEREAQIETLRASLPGLEAAADAAASAVAPLADAGDTLAGHTRQCDRHRALLADLDVQVARFEEQARAIDPDHAAALAARRALLPTLEADVETCEAAIEPLAGAQHQLEVVDLQLPGERQAWMEAREQLGRLQAEAQHIDERRAQLEEARGRLARVAAAVRRLEDALLDWRTLGEIFGRDGLPKMEIDAAGPTVSADCDSLMQASFGGRFSVELVTQEAKSSGKGLKEAFSLKVIDNVKGGAARDVSDLSGGEQVLVDECLKAALAIYANRRSPMPMRTCFRDETTGPLDAENAARYLPMLRRLLELGGFETIYFVSHHPETIAQADAQIYVHDGTAEIRYPPFGARQEAA